MAAYPRHDYQDVLITPSTRHHRNDDAPRVSEEQNLYTHRMYGYHLVHRAEFETRRNPETRNFINLIDDLYNHRWIKSDLLGLMSQLYTVFERQNDVYRCNEIDETIQYIEESVFGLATDDYEEGEGDGDEAEDGYLTPIYQTRREPFTNESVIHMQPPPLIRLRRTTNLFQSNDTMMFDNHQRSQQNQDPTSSYHCYSDNNRTEDTELLPWAV
jgi:hypothetical protein